MPGGKRKGLSLGTKIMLMMSAVTVGVSIFVFLRLSTGNSADLSRLKLQAINLQAGKEKTERSAETVTKENSSGKNIPTASNHPEKNMPATDGAESLLTMTFGGTLAIEENVRKSGYSADSKKYDFTDIIAPLVSEMESDLTGVFMENLMMDEVKVSSVAIPSAGADMLKYAGVEACFMGFSKAFDKEEKGIRTTAENLRNRGIMPLGLQETEGERTFMIRDIRGIRVAMMQYTASVPSKTRKAMEKKGISWMIPDAESELIGQDISRARTEGAQIVIVLMNWGKTGTRNPDKTQMSLAQQIADLGADVMIGAGSRVPQKAEYLVSQTGRKMLCVYSLGTLLSDNRSAPNRMGGYLVKLTFHRQEDGTIGLKKTAYVPTYVWRYRQDGKYEYRILPADRPTPDGMESEQARQMQRTMNSVQEVLDGGPLVIR